MTHGRSDSSAETEQSEAAAGQEALTKSFFSFAGTERGGGGQPKKRRVYFWLTV